MVRRITRPQRRRADREEELRCRTYPAHVPHEAMKKSSTSTLGEAVTEVAAAVVKVAAQRRARNREAMEQSTNEQ